LRRRRAREGRGLPLFTYVCGALLLCSLALISYSQQAAAARRSRSSSSSSKQRAGEGRGLPLLTHVWGALLLHSVALISYSQQAAEAAVAARRSRGSSSSSSSSSEDEYIYRIAHGGGGEHHATHSANTAAPFANTFSLAAPFVHRCGGALLLCSLALMAPSSCPPSSFSSNFSSVSSISS